MRIEGHGTSPLFFPVPPLLGREHPQEREFLNAEWLESRLANAFSQTSRSWSDGAPRGALEFFILIIPIFIQFPCPPFQPSIHPFNKHYTYLLKVLLSARRRERTQPRALSSRAAERTCNTSHAQQEVPAPDCEHHTPGKQDRLQGEATFELVLGWLGSGPRTGAGRGEKNNLSVGLVRPRCSCPAGHICSIRRTCPRPPAFPVLSPFSQ